MKSVMRIEEWRKKMQLLKKDLVGCRFYFDTWELLSKSCQSRESYSWIVLGCVPRGVILVECGRGSAPSNAKSKALHEDRVMYLTETVRDLVLKKATLV